MPSTSQRTAAFTESLIREMSRVAAQHGAINLAQGFPEWDPPAALVQAAKDAMDAHRRELAKIEAKNALLRERAASEIRRLLNARKARLIVARCSQ